jgi:hypothetical protein
MLNDPAHNILALMRLHIASDFIDFRCGIPQDAWDNTIDISDFDDTNNMCLTIKENHGGPYERVSLTHKGELLVERLCNFLEDEV